MKIKFQEEIYQLVITEHAQKRMASRNITVAIVLEVLATGKLIQKEKKNKYWVFKEIKTRLDNEICLSISLEAPFLIIITTLVNWSPLNEN